MCRRSLRATSAAAEAEAPAAVGNFREAGGALLAAANHAFTDSIGLALLVGSGVMLATAVLVKRYLPDLRGADATPRLDSGTQVAPAHAEQLV